MDGNELFEDLTAEFDVLVKKYGADKSKLMSAVVHVGLGRLAVAIQEHATLVGTSIDKVECRLDSMTYELKNQK